MLSLMQAVLDLVSSVQVPGSWLKMGLTKPVSCMQLDVTERALQPCHSSPNTEELQTVPLQHADCSYVSKSDQ
jgi:hypothetical protein